MATKRRGGTPRATRTYQCPVCEEYFVKGHITVNKDGPIHRETCSNCKGRENEVRQQRSAKPDEESADKMNVCGECYEYENDRCLMNDEDRGRNQEACGRFYVDPVDLMASTKPDDGPDFEDGPEFEGWEERSGSAKTNGEDGQ